MQSCKKNKRMDDPNFIYPKLTIEYIDRYYHRNSIFNALSEFLHLFGGSLLDVGCGKMPYKDFIIRNSSVSNYIGLDIENGNIYDGTIRPDYLWDGVTMPFQKNHFDCAIGTELLEHCPEPETTLNEVYRVLKPNGVFFFTVPFIWPLHEVPYDEYRYTPFAINRHLKNVGFKKVEVKPMSGWHGGLAQMLGLWLQRSPLNSNQRKFFTIFIWPFYRWLLKHDTIPKTFSENQMITGLFGSAYK